MKFVRNASLTDYARQFWVRQRKKQNENDLPALRDIDAGGDPIAWLVNLYPYKLPKPCNDRIQVLRFEAVGEVDKLLVHEQMPRDGWSEQRGLIPLPYSRRLGDLVSIAIERGYFLKTHGDTQIKVYTQWSAKHTIAGIIDEQGLPLIEETWPGQFEIVDGWGRLHAISALVRKGLSFEPIECFVASQTGWSG